MGIIANERAALPRGQVTAMAGRIVLEGLAVSLKAVIKRIDQMIVGICNACEIHPAQALFGCPTWERDHLKGGP